MSDITPGEMGADETQEFLTNLRIRFQGAKLRKQKRPRGHYKKYLGMLIGTPAIAFIELPKDLFNNATLTSCQTSFDSNVEKLEVYDVRSFSVYEHLNKQRLLVNWDHPDVEAQFDKWVLANTQIPTSVLAKAATEADKETKGKIEPAVKS